MPAISRSNRNTTIKLESGAQDSASIPCGNFAWGAVQFPAGTDGASFVWEVSCDGVTWSEAIGQDGIALGGLALVAGNCYPIPLDVMAAGAFRVRTAIAQTADREISVNLKG